MRWLKKYGLLFIGALAVLNLAATAGLWFMGAQYRKDIGAQSGQLAIIFYSGNDRLRRERLNFAQQLYEYGQVEAILTSGGTRPIEGIIGAEDMALQLTLRGIEASNVLVESKSKETIEGIRELSAMAEIKDYQIIYAGNCLHLPRVRHIHHQVFKGALAFDAVCPKAAPGVIEIWVDAQYEFAAWGVSYLPESWRTRFVAYLRG